MPGVPRWRVKLNFVSSGNNENIYQTFNVWAEYNWDINKLHNFKIWVDTIGGKDYKVFHSKCDLFDNETPVSDLAINYVVIMRPILVENSGFVLPVNYDFKSKYLLELNGRYDGSSKFPPGKRHVFVPSASAGWRISKGFYFTS